MDLRETTRESLARIGATLPSWQAVEEVLLSEPFDDPDPDPYLSADIDHYLYGAKRWSRET